jgi:RhoGAP domain
MKFVISLCKEKQECKETVVEARASASLSRFGDGEIEQLSNFFFSFAKKKKKMSQDALRLSRAPPPRPGTLRHRRSRSTGLAKLPSERPPPPSAYDEVNRVDSNELKNSALPPPLNLAAANRGNPLAMSTPSKPVSPRLERAGPISSSFTSPRSADKIETQSSSSSFSFASSSSTTSAGSSGSNSSALPSQCDTAKRQKLENAFATWAGVGDGDGGDAAQPNETTNPLALSVPANNGSKKGHRRHRSETSSHGISRLVVAGGSRLRSPRKRSSTRASASKPPKSPRGGASSRSHFFGTSLQSSIDYCAEVGRPHLIDLLMPFIACHIGEEGLFRVSGDAAEVAELKQLLDAGQSPKYEAYHVHSVAGVLKQYFRELAEPLVPFDMYDALVELAQSVSDAACVSALALFIGRLPPANFDFLSRLALFLRKIAECEGNKMTYSNVAVVFAPNIFRAPDSADPSSLLANASRLNDLFALMIEHADAIFNGDKDGASASSSSRRAKSPSPSVVASPAAAPPRVGARPWSPSPSLPPAAAAKPPPPPRLPQPPSLSAVAASRSLSPPLRALSPPLRALSPPSRGRPLSPPPLLPARSGGRALSPPPSASAVLPPPSVLPPLPPIAAAALPPPAPASEAVAASTGFAPPPLPIAALPPPPSQS